jgi:Ca2+-binding EF-hand superfamily protein
MKRPPKKNDTLEIRLPTETKRAFMERCRAEDSTASDKVRGFIEADLARPLKTKEQPMFFRPATSYASLAAIAAFAAVGAAFFMPSTGRAAPDLKAMFQNLDANKDGKISAAEFASQKDVMFKRADAAPLPPGEKPKELFITLAPPPNHLPPAPPPGMVQLSGEERANMEARRFSEFDADKDEAVTFEEFVAHHRSMLTQAFKSMDANGDGEITQAEMEPPPPLPDASGKPHMRVAFRGAPGEDSFAKLDKNKDGAISEEEFADTP